VGEPGEPRGFDVGGYGGHMPAVLHVKGDREPGPGDRFEVLDRVRAWLDAEGASDIIRIDVPGRGEEGAGALRLELEPLVPALQSGSLFSDLQGVEVIDAQNLSAAEAGVVAELLVVLNADAVRVAFASFGALPPALAKTMAGLAQVEEVKKFRERDAAAWLTADIKERGLSLDGEAAAALLQRFGSDVAAMEQALDQFDATREKVTAKAVLDRFRNRPDEPMWHYFDAVVAGDVGEALRRLADFLTHDHPLQLLGYLEGEIRWQSIASSSADLAGFAVAVGARDSDRRVAKVWKRRGTMPDSQLARALEALVKADRILKSAPDDLHQVTMERLTVALCRWLGRRKR